MRERGRGKRRGIAMMIVVLALSVAAPAMFAPAGAAESVNTQSHATRVELVAKHVKRKAHRKGHVKRHKPMTAAMKKAKLVSYIKAHPAVVAAHAKNPAAPKVKPAKGHYLAGPAKKKKKKPAAKKKPHAKKAVHKKKKKKKSSGSGLKRSAMLLVLLSIGGVGLFLIVSSLRNAPRARARARARKRAQPLPSS